MIFGMDRFAERTAFETDSGAVLSYADVLEQMHRFSTFLEGPRSLAICLCENSVECITGYLTFLEKGVVPIMLGAQLEPAFVRGYVDEFRPRYIWKPRSLQIDIEGFSTACQLEKYELLIRNSEETVALHSELAVLATTSGSTGSKKLVRQTIGNININAAGIVESLELDEDTSTITTLPMNYTFGMSIVHTHLSVGSAIHVTTGTIVQKEFWERMRTRKISVLYGVPFTFEMLKKLKINRQALPHLQALAQAGGKLSPDLCDYFSTWCSDVGKRFHIMYGQAEATTRISCFCTNDHPNKIGSVGRPLAGGNVEIKPLTPEEGDTDRFGEIIYRGSNVGMGYALDCGDLAKEDEWCGELATGDLGYLDEDGFIYIEGRKKRIVKLYGHSISLDDVEKHLSDENTLQLPCIADGEKIIVFHDGNADVSGLPKAVAAKLKLRSSDFKLVEIASVPRTDSGKVDYRQLNTLYQSALQN